MKNIWVAISGLGVVLALAGLWFWMIVFQPYVRTNDALLDGYKVAVCSDITARVMKLYFDEGAYVKAGDLIADLDDSILQSQKIDAEANVETLKRRVPLEEYSFEKIRNDYERALKGFEEGVTTAQDLDHAQKNFSVSKSRVEVTKAELIQAITELGVIDAKLLHTKVWAPFDGMIVKRWIMIGDVMHPGQAMFSLYDLKDVWVLANLEETKMERVRLGDPVEIHLDTYPEKIFHGSVFVIKGAAASEFSLIPQDNATGNYTKVAQRIPLKISIEKPKSGEELYFFPGMSAEVKIKVR